MKYPVEITFTSAGLQPPVYVTTSLSDPQWEPIEMEFDQSKEGEHEFFKSFDAEEGEYQYKFRLGPGEWWVHDETRPAIDDGFGNKNNFLTVKRKDHSVPEPVEPAPLMKHEMSSAKDAPLMKHEMLSANDNTIPDPSASSTTEVEDVKNENGLQEPLLLRHESLSPESAEQEQAPLFRHESISLDEHQSANPFEMAKSAPRLNVQDSLPQEAGPLDEMLEHFPTSQEGIMEKIRKVSTSLPADETTPGLSSPASMAASTASDSSLQSVKEGDEDTLGEIAESQFEDAEDERNDEVHVDRPAAPITPPMTPTPEQAAKASALYAEEQSKQVDFDGPTPEATEASAKDVSQPSKTPGGVKNDGSPALDFKFWAVAVGITVAVVAGIWKLQLSES